MHLRVFDEDTFTSDDCLGELICELAALPKEEPQDLALRAKDDSSNTTGTAHGTVRILAGPKVDSLLFDHLRSHLDAAEAPEPTNDNSGFSVLPLLAHKLGSVFVGTAEQAHYLHVTLSYLLAAKKEPSKDTCPLVRLRKSARANVLLWMSDNGL